MGNFSPLIPAAPPSVPAPALLKPTQVKPSTTEVESTPPTHSTASVSPIPPEVLERNNNDKSPNKRLINEADDQQASETKKVKSETASSSSAASIKPVDRVSPRLLCVATRRYDFSLPQS